MKAKLRGAVKSWTMWVNTIGLVVLSMIPTIEAQMQASLTPDQYRTFGLIMLVVNIALRVKTAKDLADK